MATNSLSLTERVDDAARQVFLSYSSEDQYFVPLLVELLKLHGHGAWYAKEGIRAGALFSTEIDTAIQEADTLIAVLSENAAQSKWIPREVGKFEAVHAGRPIIPILLESIDPETVYPGLGSYQAIDFSTCILSGLQELFSDLGNDFLSTDEIRDRRSGSDRRAEGVERRVVKRERGLFNRLKIGFHVAYARELDDPRQHSVDQSPPARATLVSILTDESQKYRFLDKDSAQEMDRKAVIEGAVDRVRRNDSQNRDINTILSLVADDIANSYEVRMVDRRRRGRRLG